MSGNIMNQVNQDLNECISLINKGIHTFIVRPTFYPKEELLSLIINSIHGNKLVIHMNDEDKNKIYKKVSRKLDCDFISYRKLALSGFENLGTQYSVILFNEANLIGGDKVSEQIDGIIKRNSGAVRVGITSTPFRNDSKDIRQSYFTSELSQFGMQEAIDNKIISSLYYVYCSSVQNTQGSSIKDILNISSVINKTLKEVYKEVPSVLNIVCFIDGGAKKQISYNILKKMLYETFSGYTIVMENGTRFGDSKKVIIVDVNPNLNRKIESAHIAMLFRETHSQRVFIKQIGAILDCKKTDTPIVFDMVDNLNKKSIAQLNAGQLSDEFKREANIQISRIIVKDYLANNNAVIKKLDKHNKVQQSKANNFGNSVLDRASKLGESDIDYRKECISRNISISGKVIDEDYIDRVNYLRQDFKMPIHRIMLETDTELEMVIIALSLSGKIDTSKADSCIYKGPKPLSRSVNFTTFVTDYSIAVRQAFLRKRQLNCGISKRIFNKDVTLTETITDRIYKKVA